MSLPKFKSEDLTLQLMQFKWAAELDPVLNNPSTNPTLLKNINIVAGDNIINHLLGRTPQGWFIVDVDAAATIYRSAPFNNLTLTLNSSAPAIISLAVY